MRLRFALGFLLVIIGFLLVSILVFLTVAREFKCTTSQVHCEAPARLP
jgi:uncharacterized membrane protein